MTFLEDYNKCYTCEDKDEEIKKLTAALEKIGNGDGIYGAQAFEYKNIARKALSKPKVGFTKNG